MKTQQQSPPALFHRFFRWFCRPELRNYIEGDLLELYHERIKTSGERNANLKFMRDVLLLFRPGIIKPARAYQNLMNNGMYKHYFTTGYRNLWKNKTYSILNILGLTGGTVCCLYILLYVQEQYSFDHHHKDADRIYRVTTDIITPDKTDRMATISPIILTSAQEDFPEIEVAARVMKRHDANDHLFRTGDKSFYVSDGLYADSTFFEVFTYRMVEGSAGSCLDQPLSMAISSGVAKKLFGDDSALNKTITMTNHFGTNDFNITAVYDENYGRSHLRPNFVMNIYSGRLGMFTRRSQTWAWDNNAHGYVKLKPGADAKAFAAKLTAYVAKRGKQELADLSYVKVMRLQPVKDIHVSSNLNMEIDKNSNAKFLYILSIIAAFIQVIACINFMNLSTARSATRAKEIGVRKSAGAGKISILWQFMSESMLVTCLSIVLALPLFYLLLPSFNNISQYNLSVDIFSNPSAWQTVMALIVITGLIAGSYPAFYLSSFKAIEVLKGNFRHRLSAVSLRKSLVVFQFMISIGLIVGVMIIRNQVKYMQGKDLGFNKEQKLVIPFRSRDAINKKAGLYKEEIRKLAGIRNVAAIYDYPGRQIRQDIDLYKQGQTMNEARIIFYNQVDENYFDAMEIPVLAGRGFTRADTLNQIIINEAAVKELGFDRHEALGQIVYTGPSGEATAFPIIGVVKDFNFSSLHEPVKPLFFRYNRKNPNVVVALQTSDYQTLLANLETSWKKINPDEPFVYSFVDETLARQYETENTLLRIINSFTVLAVFICCLGLFGLAAFTAEQRTKEIGIRKVLGATIENLVGLLSKDFMKLVLIACLIITPVAWWAMNQWLEEFAYRINISWWVFALAASMALLIAMITISFQAIKAALANPVKSLRSE